MGKKNRFKNIFDRASIEPTDAHPESTEPSQEDEQSGTNSPAENMQSEGMETSGRDEESADERSLPAEELKTEETDSTPIELEAGEQQEAIPSERDSEGEDERTGGEAQEAPLAVSAEETPTEDVLADVRRSLIEEESDKSQKESRWWRRLGRKGKKSQPEVTPPPVEIDLPAVSGLEGVTEVQQPEVEPEEEIDEIEDLINMLEAESEAPAAESTIAPEAEVAAEPEQEVDFEELKKQAFQPRPDAEPPQEMTDVRAIALEGGEEVLVEVESKPVDPMQERIGAFENALKPYRSYIYSAIALLGVGVAVVAALILFNVYQQSQPEPVREAPDLPYPTAVSLPGGWSFQLGRGTLQEGRWEPSGAEWLEGTEVCRWVALPWSTQLEAVIRTLKPQDPIELVMSNNDRFVYEVYSRQELTLEEIQQLDSNSACLLLILTQSDSEKRWVVTALP